jgi:hypothetical protein
MVYLALTAQGQKHLRSDITYDCTNMAGVVSKCHTRES